MTARAYFNDETIAAIVTAPDAVSGLGVIRISGKEAWAAAARLIRRPSGEPFVEAQVRSHSMRRCLLVSTRGDILDDGMFAWMKAPRSLTGEDVVELYLHGNPFLLRRAMEELLTVGVREAQAGEFSFRAFRSGKLSLDQAESVAELIASRSEEGARRAIHHLLGHSREGISSLKGELVGCLAEVEVEIDFSDQGLSSFDPTAWAKRLAHWCRRLEEVQADFLKSRPLREGIRLALVGEPNSGKSSLFNRLLGEDRSIVSKQAGTTRDVVREYIQIRGLLFRFADTAGIRDTKDEIEARGVERTLEEAEQADLILWVFDGTKDQGAIGSLEVVFQRFRKDTSLIAVWNKSDLNAVISDKFDTFFKQHNIPVVILSALTGHGVSTLIEEITELFMRKQERRPNFSISRTRHYEVLGKALDSVRAAIAKVGEGQLFPDLLATDLRMAIHYFSEITGEFTSEDLLQHIFSEFCIGK